MASGPSCFSAYGLSCCVPFREKSPWTQLAELSSSCLKDGGSHFPGHCHRELSFWSCSLAFQIWPWIGEFLFWSPSSLIPLLPPVSGSFVPPLLFLKIVYHIYLFAVWMWGKRNTHVVCGCCNPFSSSHYGALGI